MTDAAQDQQADTPRRARRPRDPQEPARRGAGSPPAARPWLPWIVAVLAAIVALVSTVQWMRLADREAARGEVEAAAAEFVLELTNWDARDGLSDTRETLETMGTGAFRDEVSELFGGDLGAELEAVGASSRGEVQDVFLQRVEGDTATVFAVVTQTIENARSSTPDVTARSARLVLERVDGSWLVRDLELVEDTMSLVPAEEATP